MSKGTYFALTWFCFGITFMNVLNVFIEQNEYYFIGFICMSVLGAYMFIKYHQKDFNEGTF